MFNKKLLIVSALAISLLMFTALGGATAEAARAGGGGKPSGGSSVTLTVSPNPAPAGTTDVTVTGSGFRPGQQVWTGIVGFISHMVTADSGGSFSYVESQEFTPGNYQVVAYTEGGGGKWVLTKSTTLTVSP